MKSVSCARSKDSATSSEFQESGKGRVSALTMFVCSFRDYPKLVSVNEIMEECF